MLYFGFCHFKFKHTNFQKCDLAIKKLCLHSAGPKFKANTGLLKMEHAHTAFFGGRIIVVKHFSVPWTWNSLVAPFLSWSQYRGAGGSMCACHAAGPGSIPDRDKFFGWGFFRGFSSPVRQMSGNFRPPWFPEYHLARISFGHHNHSLRAPMTSDVDAP